MAKNKGVPGICQHCGTPFLARKQHLKTGGGRFCTVKCARATSSHNPCWTNEEDEALRTMCKQHNNAAIAVALGRTECAVKFRLRRLSLNRPPEFFLTRGPQQHWHAYPPELREVMALQKAIERKLHDVQEPS